MAAHVDTSKIKMTYGSYRFWPAPLMSMAIEPLKTEAGKRLADRVTLSFAGSLLNTDNLSSGNIANMWGLQSGLSAALSGDNQELQVLHHINSTLAQGEPIISGIYPRVENLAFGEGTWVDKVDYSFDLTYETNLVSGAVPIETYSDDWDFEEDASVRVIRASHSVSAKGINTTISGGDSNALEFARTWVNARMGADSMPSGLPQFCASGDYPFKLQKYRTEAASVTDGTYSATEEITVASGSYAHSYTAQIQQDTAGITVVTINGNVEGLGRFDEAIDHAVSGWNVNVSPVLSGMAAGIYTELSGGGSLNIGKVLSLSITKDVFSGRVGYSTSYDDDPKQLPSGIAEFNITKQIKLPVRKKAIFGIPSRIAGSIVHDIGTPTDGSIAINGTAQGVIDTQLDYVRDYCSDQVNVLRPNVALYNEMWFGDYNKTENEDQKTFSFSITWNYTDNLTNVPNPSGEVSF